MIIQFAYLSSCFHRVHAGKFTTDITTSTTCSVFEISILIGKRESFVPANRGVAGYYLHE